MTSFRSRLFWLAVLIFFFAGHSSIMAYTVKGLVRCSAQGWVPYGAVVKVFEVDPLPGGGYAVDEIPLTSPAVVNEKGEFTAESGSPYGGGGFEVGDPDLLFQFLQNINGTVETIYEEEPAKTRWNVRDNRTFKFKITSPLAVCFNPAITPGMVPANKLFLFTRVGNYETAEIDCKGSSATSEGYYLPRKAPYNKTGISSDTPFGRTLDLFGWFGQLCNVDYYMVQYSSDGGTSWTDMETGLPNKWYDTSDANPLNWHWVSESMGPVSYGGMDNLYRIPYKVKPGVPWSFLDRVARFDTLETADGINRVRVVGYKKSGVTLVAATSADLLIDPNYGEIVLQVDNTPPIVNILNLKLNGVSKPPCDILNFGAADTITVECRVWDQRGHLRTFALAALYGHNQYVSPIPAGGQDNYAAHGSPLWQGSMSFNVSYNGGVYDSGKMPTCAYQFRLHASKRTSNGYGLIYDWVEDTWHVTIQR